VTVIAPVATPPTDLSSTLIDLAKYVAPRREAVADVIDAVMARHSTLSETSWRALVDDLGRTLGFRVTWVAADAAALAEELFGDAAAVTWSSGEGFTALAMAGGSPVARRWPGGLTLSQLPAQPAQWALLEQALPASALSATGPDAVRKALGRIWGLVVAERRDTGLIAIYAAAVTLLGLATPVAVQVLVNTVAFGTMRLPIVAGLGLLGVCLGFAAALRLLHVYVVELIQRRLFVRLVTDLAERLPRLRMDVFDARRPADLVHRFFDVVTAQKALAAVLVDGVEAVMQTLVALVLLAVYHPLLLGFDVLVLAGMIGLLVLPTRRAAEAAIDESYKKYAIAGLLDQVAQHPELYRHAGGPRLVLRRADRLAYGWLKHRARHFRMYAVQHGGALALQALANVGLLGAGAVLVLDGGLSLGQLVAAEFVVASALIGFSKFSRKLESVYDLIAAVDKLGLLVDLPVESAGGRVPELDGPASVGLFEVAGRGLDRASLEVAAGERVGVVAEPGPARHALADAIAGLWVPEEGRLVLDGTDASDVHLPSWREHVALLRESEVVQGTLYDNVALGRDPINRSVAAQVLERVGLGPTVAALPDGLDTDMGPRGEPLSEGNRVRLAVARALAGDPRLVVVDGLLDRPEVDDDAQRLRALLENGGTRTLVLFTRRAELVPPAARTLRLADGALHETPGVER
jgi:putative ABC transport system ATP-binding protein